MIKLFAIFLLRGIAFGCFYFVANVISHELFDFVLIPYILETPTANALSIIVICIGFFGGSIIYEIERLGFVLQLVIHLAIGVSIFLIVAFNIGWISTDNPTAIVLNIIFNVFVVFAIWIVSYLREEKKVEKINEMIAEKQSKKPLDTE
jgi:uncharacterized membrane protein (UPF0136 family)